MQLSRFLSTKRTRFINRQKTAGDYNKGQLAEAMDKPTITGDAVKHYLKLCNGKASCCFLRICSPCRTRC